jgi:hypothetical protein
MTITYSTQTSTGNLSDQHYSHFLNRVQQRFIKNCENGKQPLFLTDVNNLWDVYLNSFPSPHFNDDNVRQYYNCRSCQQFIQKYGGLVTIDENGTTIPAMWDIVDAPYELTGTVSALYSAVRSAKVIGVFLSSEKSWGTAVTGIWRHLSVVPPSAMVFNNRALTAFQAMAGKSDDFKTVMRALDEYKLSHLETALTLLRSDALYRSEKVLGQAVWLYNLQVDRTHGGANKVNKVWKAIATAPDGFCHPRSSMIGTLLEDIVAGKPFDVISRAFARKMNPTVYQRPQVAPTSGSIAAAEKLVEKMNVAPALERRFAQLNELQAIWRPLEHKPQGTGVFGHLLPKGSQTVSMNIPAQTMTWDKFQRTVLPTAEKITLLAPSLGTYTAFVTATNADAIPILQWDMEENRNPVSTYVWRGGSTAQSFGLLANEYVEVEAITLRPSMWNGVYEHQGKGVIFVLAGARESRKGGLALFPEILKSEFHGIRSVIEAYSRNGIMGGFGQPHAAGILFDSGGSWNCRVRVYSGNNTFEYQLDRWD